MQPVTYESRLRGCFLPVMVAVTAIACAASSGGAPTAVPTSTAEGQSLVVQTQTLDETSESEPTYTVHAEWPVFQGNTSNIDGLNSQAEAVAQEQMDRFRMGLKDLTPMPESERSSFRLVYTVEESPAGLVAVRYDIDQYWEGAANSRRSSRTLNYSLALGRRLILADLFGSNSEYLTRLAVYANGDLERQGYKPPSGVPLIAADASYFEAWLGAPAGIELIFSPLICCGPAGEGQVLVPYEVFADLIDREYKDLWE